jgi:hypothetical protein
MLEVSSVAVLPHAQRICRPQCQLCILGLGGTDEHRSRTDLISRNVIVVLRVLV